MRAAAHAASLPVRSARDGQPFLKWAGGKRALASKIFKAFIPDDISERAYREPFVGGGAMYFYLVQNARPRKSYLSDALGDLVTTYKVVRGETDALIEKLTELRDAHSSETFYQVRDAFNERRTASNVERAAWLIYLNKTCFNGLFRTNKEGLFNVPLGSFKNPAILDESRLRAAAAALRGAHVVKRHFQHLVHEAEEGDVIYLDPPYVPISRTASFASYADGQFGMRDQEELAKVFRELDARGCLLALSNSDTEEVRRLYAGFDIQTIVANRNISRTGSTRKPVAEVLVLNAPPPKRSRSRRDD